MSDRGPWLQTFSGHQFFPLTPHPEDFYIVDIAHALSNICRFAGHCREFYSVAQHSVLVAYRVAVKNPELALEALLHDASEAYLTDLPRPIKHSPKMQAYRTAEKVMELALAEQYKLRYPWPAAVKVADDRMLMTERRDLLGKSPLRWDPALEQTEPYSNTITPWSPKKAKRKFLAAFDEIMQYRKTK